MKKIRYIHFILETVSKTVILIRRLAEKDLILANGSACEMLHPDKSGFSMTDRFVKDFLDGF